VFILIASVQNVVIGFQKVRKLKKIVMTNAEYIRLLAQISVLKEIQQEYPHKTIDNIIQQMEAVRKEVEK
jgi:hypothetical protein